MTTWHEQHEQSLTFGERVSDAVAKGMGSWTFIIIQTVLVSSWIGLNLVAWFYHWDAMPFILLNLIFSTQAAYASPLILMAANRASDRDTHQANEDYRTNIAAKQEIEALQEALAKLELEKMDVLLSKADRLIKLVSKPQK